ncbi:MAG: 2-succinyl-6-hydroxy-2,4-cyclohexadiene-1-carboxylate synthase [Verrucomicrobia bacterium]|nr:MAG: 2-succinyl-6-hydroxy-2,4-cyclohexadiene-1-carboxylate synthase [Verrucomicrobiota bacterium]
MHNLHVTTWNQNHPFTTPILALHGFTGSGLDFECFTQKTLNYFSWYAPDLLGHGKSPIPHKLNDYSLESHIHYLDKITLNLPTGSPWVLLGYSMGGRLALKYALERPQNIKHLILISSTPGILDNHERLLRQQTDNLLDAKILGEGVANFINFWQELPIIQSQKNIPPSIREPLLKRKFNNHPLGLANSLLKMGTGQMLPLWNRLSEIKFPITLITGEKDFKFTEIAHQMKHNIPHLEHHIIPNTGHAAIWEHPISLMNLLILNPNLQ